MKIIYNNFNSTSLPSPVKYSYNEQAQPWNKLRAEDAPVLRASEHGSLFTASLIFVAPVLCLVAKLVAKTSPAG